ncbi:Hypothetical predicted protein [Mytilus galloprovincialis]|uniref:Uncharacterized protein n=1 Tax=Mytilus galloprovincialis TaxID=29158 RepID=A0A8B6GQX2_MYTGA|nr:Hypothetical predicted protein [Mytilus galloprovincialis]
MSLENTTAQTTTARATLPNTKAPGSYGIDTASQDAINFVLWGASGLAVLILFIRLIISVVHRFRRRHNEGVPFWGNSSRCTLQEAPPPNYSQISIRTLPPTYSQGCRITHYHPSTGNVSQQTTSTGNDVPVNEAYSNYIADTDFTVSPSNDNNETIDDVFDAPTNTNSESGNNVCQTQVSNDNNSDNRQSRTHIEND